MQVMLHKYVVLFLVCKGNLVCHFCIHCVTIQMKATEQKLSCGTVYYAVQGGSNF